MGTQQQPLNGDVDLTATDTTTDRAPADADLDATSSQVLAREIDALADAKRPKVLMKGREFLQHAKQNIARMLTYVPMPWLGDGFGMYVRPFTSKQRGAMEQYITREIADPQAGRGKTKKEVKYELAQAYIAFCCACDETGAQVFIGCDLDEIADSLDARTAQAIQDAATKASGIAPSDIDEIAGN